MTKANTVFEVIEVDSPSVMCDGGNGVTGHPQVYLQMKQGEQSVVCPYCSRTFQLSE